MSTFPRPTPRGAPQRVPPGRRAGWLAALADRLRLADRGAGRKQTDLRVLLAAIPVLSVLPLMAFSVGLLNLLADTRTAEARRDLQHAAQTVAVALEREIGGSIRRLETIADLPAAAADDLAALQRIAGLELRRNDDWTNLVLRAADGQIVFSSAPVEDAQARPLASHLSAVLESGRPAVSDVFASSVDGRPSVAVTVPVRQGGSVQWLLSARLNEAALSRRLAEQLRRQGAVGELFDRDGRVVARSLDVARWFGHRAGAGYGRLVEAAPSGTAAPFPRSAGAAGEDAALGAWARLPFGWSVALTLAGDDAPRSSGSVWMIGLLGVGLLGASLLFAAAIARRITGIVAEAGRAARDVALARRPRLRAPPIRQFSTLFDAMNEAGERVVDALGRERSARAAAEAADRQKDRFLVMLGHELRNPLNAVGNAGHLLRRRDLTEGQRDGVVVLLQRQSRQLRRLVDDLLDLGRVLTGKLALRLETVAVDTLLRQSIATLGTTGQLGGHTVDADLEPVVCEVDPVRFEQVFSNLFGNAIKYTPSGGAISVRLSLQGDAMVLSVRDNGIGIDAAEQQRIFGLFVQGPQADDRAAGGLGVGLSMARMLVEMHGGTIDAHSAGRGQGSEFVVRIPGARPAAVQGPDPDGSA
jgi:signal transduction histidine kinase